MSNTREAWDMSDGPFWDLLKCDGLFNIFSTDAHVSDGVPDVPVAKVLHHVIGCQTCQRQCVQVHGAANDAPCLTYD